MSTVIPTPYIPENITVHLGRPNQEAPNLEVPFPDYIKNVASSEIFPTWPESAIRANIYAQISFALNRVYTEWYRSQGYPFDITNSTTVDQYFVPNRDIFENISQIVDEVFNTYVRRYGNVEPLFTQYCNGTTATCEGLSQWGTVPLAEQGYTPFEILQYFYGDDIVLERNASVQPAIESYPGAPLRQGSSGEYVRMIQNRLNRISRNYPAIPKLTVDGQFGPATASSVEAFQRIFNLTVDGIVGRATWYRIAYIYTAVKRLAEIQSEGLTVSEVSREYTEELRIGDTGEKVRLLQYFLRSVGDVYQIPIPPALDGIFGPLTQQSVMNYQRLSGITPDGIVNERTWNSLYAAYRGIEDVLTEVGAPVLVPFPGVDLYPGDYGPSVRVLQEYLEAISRVYPEIPAVAPLGQYGELTEIAVRQFQQLFDLPATGITDEATWNRILSVYDDIRSAQLRQSGQFPGVDISQNTIQA